MISLLIRSQGDSWSYIIQLRTQKYHWDGAWGPLKWGPDRIYQEVSYIFLALFSSNSSTIVLYGSVELTACHLFSSYSWLWPWAWRSDVFNILPDMNTFRNSNGILGCIIESNEARNGIIEKVLNESHFSKEISWPLFLQIKCNLERTMNTFFRVRNTIEKHTTLCHSTNKMIECHTIISTKELGTFKLI